jgi:hypothetical protein
MNNDQTAVILTEAGYRKITGNEPEAESTSVPTTSNVRRVVILTALEVETRAVLRHLPDWKDDVVRNIVFYRGRFENWDIAIAEVGAGNYALGSAIARQSAAGGGNLSTNPSIQYAATPHPCPPPQAQGNRIWQKIRRIRKKAAKMFGI